MHSTPPRCTKRTAPVHKTHRPGAQKHLRLALQSLVNFKVFGYLTHMQNISGLLLLDYILLLTGMFPFTFQLKYLFD